METEVLALSTESADVETRYAEQAVAAMRTAGLRITRPRRSIVELLERSARPLTAGAIHEQLKRRRILVDLASVYRTLTVLEERGLIHRLATVEGVVRCEPGFEGSACHHHLVCSKCQSVREVRCDGLEALRRSIADESGYRIERHAVELVGLCPSCAAGQPNA